jgi:Ca2+-transporting ATPase
MKRPPRDPNARFLDRSMLAGIVAGGLTLALISGGAFMFSLSSLGVDGARTLALVSWLVGHAVLGVVMGWERRPVSVRGLVNNPAMLGWIGAAAAFSLALLLVPGLAMLLHARPVEPGAAAVALAVAVLVPFWLEIPKRLRS